MHVYLWVEGREISHVLVPTLQGGGWGGVAGKK